MEFVQYDSELESDWDRLVESSQEGWSFSLSAWRQVILGVPQWQLEDLSFAVRENGRLVAAFPLQFSPLTCIVASTGFGGSGPVLAVGLGPQHRRRLLYSMFERAANVARERGARSLEFQVSPVTRGSLAAKRGVNPFLEFGFVDRSGHSRVIDLSVGEEALWASLSADARQQVKRAKAKGYTAAYEPWTSLIDDYYRVHTENYVRTGVRPHPREYFRGIAEYMSSRGNAVLWVARDPGGQPVAFHNDTGLAHARTYHTGCCETAHLDSGANYLLFWESLRGAVADGCSWYDAGEVFPGVKQGKEAGLSVFKSKFGGNIHRVFRCALGFEALDPTATSDRSEVADARPSPGRRWLAASRDLAEATLGPRVAGVLVGTGRPLVRAARAVRQVPRRRREAPATVNGASPDAERRIRREYECGDIYRIESICSAVDEQSPEYVHRQLRVKLDLVRRHRGDGLVVDLCCATGKHLFHLREEIDRGLGLDFSRRYLQAAETVRLALGAKNVSFACADAKRLPLSDESVGTIYSFSSLYAIPGVDAVFAEIARVLRPGGRCVLDLGNRRSLNSICVRAYPENPPLFAIDVSVMNELCRRNRLRVIERRIFQLLPLWADRPRWLRPVLAPFWKRVMGGYVAGRMVDEWISGLPGIRSFAFRHVLVCEKAPA